MHDNKLYKSIQILYDMELNRFFISRCISKVKDRAALLNTTKKLYQKPTMPEEPKKEECEKNKFFELSYFVDQPVVRLLIGLVVGALIGLGVCLIRYLLGYQDNILATTVLFALCGIGVTMILIPLYMVIDFFVASIRYPDQDYNLKYDNYKEELKVYNTSLNDYIAHNQREEERVKREALEKKRLDDALTRLQELLKLTDRSLERYYEAVNVFPNYRYIVAIGYMFEFVSIGITDKLEGVDGLYYLIMNELKPYQIELSADDILKDIDSHVGKQRSVYYEILEKEKESDALVRKCFIESGKNKGDFDRYLNSVKASISKYDAFMKDYSKDDNA